MDLVGVQNVEVELDLDEVHDGAVHHVVLARVLEVQEKAHHLLRDLDAEGLDRVIGHDGRDGRDGRGLDNVRHDDGLGGLGVLVGGLDAVEGLLEVRRARDAVRVDELRVHVLDLLSAAHDLDRHLRELLVHVLDCALRDLRRVKRRGDLGHSAEKY